VATQQSVGYSQRMLKPGITRLLRLELARVADW
jgi:hypothetical protein